MVSKSGITFQSRCFFAFTQTYHIGEVSKVIEIDLILEEYFNAA